MPLALCCYLHALLTIIEVNSGLKRNHYREVWRHVLGRP